LLLAALALAGATAVIGGLGLRRAARARPPALEQGPVAAASPERPTGAVAPGAVPVHLPAHLPPPRLAIAPPPAGAGQLWDQAGQLTDDERQQLEARDVQAREVAAAGLGLDEPERARIRLIHDRSDAQVAELALRASQGETDGSMLALRTLARGELEALTEVLGADRASAYRRQERAAYRAQWRRQAMDATAAAPVKAASRRRLVFLR
jgi:hypothetical protein